MILNLDPSSMVNNFSPSTPMSTPIFVIWDMTLSLNVKINIFTWLDRNVSENVKFMELPSSEVPLSNLSSHLQLLLSMLSIVAGERYDRYISLEKLSIAYQIFFPNSPTIYDWAIAISDGICEQLVEIDQRSHFECALYIIWLLIHQNFEVFKNLNLVKYEKNGSPRFVDRWTKEVRSSTDYYSFIENFLILAEFVCSNFF